METSSVSANIRAKIWTGEASSLALAVFAGMVEEERGIKVEQQRFVGSGPSIYCCQRLGLTGINGDQITNARQRQNVAVMLVQPIGEQALLLAVCAPE